MMLGDGFAIIISLSLIHIYAEYRFDAQSPSFDGLKGIYPLKFWHEADGKEERGVINLVSDDGGRTWAFEEKNDSN